MAKRSCTTTLSWDTANTLEMKSTVALMMMMMMVVEVVMMILMLILFFYLQFSDSSCGRRFSNSKSSLGET